MQVMPETARAPGFGLSPANPNDPADMNRLGRQYRQAMHGRYGGDLAKMWGAYNAGPGRMDGLLRTHGDNWYQHAPLETRQFISKNLEELRRRRGY